ncbi:MAG TPA: tetratricopeptide repeat protein [Chitinophagaceae bacterium]
MKRYLLVFVLLFVMAAAFSQPGKKLAAKEKPPTQKEMNDMMKEMQAAMDEMSPEDKRAMDSMGIKMPSLKNIPKATDKQLADAWEQDAQLVPKKNAARIAAIPQIPTAAALPGFISMVHTTIVAKLTAAEKTEAETLYGSIKQNSNIGTANAAISFWIQKRPMLAIYLMGKACQDEPGNIDNSNNYAAMLTMAGAEQAAIPVLQNLNKRFPNNSTVLNNLGQAWFGLGDLDKASRYLDSAVRIYAYHSQANYTKCLIEESRGHTQAAADALIRSIKKNHSLDKESKLRKLGKKLSGKDIDFPFKMPQDPLGLEKFSWPAYPMSVTESAMQEEVWKNFIADCEATLSELNSKAAQLEKNATDAIEKRMKAIIQASQTGKPVSPIPWYAPMAILKLNYLVEDKDNGLQFRMERSLKAVTDVLLKDAEWDNARIAQEKVVEEKYEPLIGEGRPNPIHQYCSDINKIRSEYLQLANTQLQMVQESYFNDQRKMINDQVYYSQYINWPEEFEVIKIYAKIKWLNLIKNQVVRFKPLGPFCENSEGDKPKKTKLSAFDDVACKYHSSSDIGIMEFNNDCSRFEGKLKLGKLTYTRKIDSDDHDKLLAASLELKVGAGTGWEKGPVQAEVNAEITGKMEWNDKEITNWEVTSEVNVSAGSNLGHGDKSIDIAGVKAHIGMISSGSLTGKGMLQNVNFGNK